MCGYDFASSHLARTLELNYPATIALPNLSDELAPGASLRSDGNRFFFWNSAESPTFGKSLAE